MITIRKGGKMAKWKNMKVKPFSKELLNLLFRSGDAQLSVVNETR